MSNRIIIKVPRGATPEERQAAIHAGLRQYACDLGDEIMREALKKVDPKGNA